MHLLSAAAWLVLVLLAALGAFTHVNAWLIERRNPPTGSFIEVDGTRIHHVHLRGPDQAELPPILFIHGASANLNDQMASLRPLLEGRVQMLFLDRPGHGWSQENRPENLTGRDTQASQATLIAKLMDQLGIGPAIIVAHSFGGSVAAAFALDHPDKTAGLVFLSAATHPWPGGGTSWYYRVAALPVVGWLFSQTVAGPAGMLRLADATRCVFEPNTLPQDYLSQAQIPLVLRPRAFRANARDVQGLYRFTLENAPRYREITAPTIVITGDADTVVYEEIHSRGLARDIAGSELVWVRNLGHKPDWIAADLVVAAIEKLGGQPRDLQTMRQAVEARIAGDVFSPGCAATEAQPSPAKDGASAGL